MTDTTTPITGHAGAALEAAHEALSRTRAALTDSGAVELYQVVVSSEDIVDHVRRVNLPTASLHYRAEKSAPVVAAGLRLQRDTLAAYGLVEAVHRNLVDEDFLDELLADITSRIETAFTASAAVMWDLARMGAPSEQSAEALRTATRDLAHLASRMVAAAVPDPEG